MRRDLSMGHLVRTTSEAHGRLLENCGYVKVPAELKAAALAILKTKEAVAVSVVKKSPFAKFVMQERQKKKSLFPKKIMQNA